MRELAGKTAFVTGGAAGIGLALGRAFAQAGMKVMLADIEADALQAAVKSLQEISPRHPRHRLRCRRSRQASSARRRPRSTPSATCMWCATMPASPPAAASTTSRSTIGDGCIDVNLMGVLHGIKSFLPHIRAHGEGGHIVNTASMAGMQSGLGFSPYGASKFAVVSMSEGLGHAAQAARHRRQRAVPELRAHPHRRERAQPARALRPVAAARSGQPGGGHGGRDRQAISRRGWSPTQSPRACWPRSGTMSSTCSPIPACGPRWRRGLPPFWPRWTGFRPHNPAHARP